jgi:poly(A) polymerase Pap1
VSDQETQARLQQLLDRLEDARQRLEQSEDSEAAVDVLQDLVQLAKEVQAEIERQKRGGGDAPA